VEEEGVDAAISEQLEESSSEEDTPSSDIED